MALQKDVSLGEFLRYERELRGITIEQVASATKVGVRTLHALEADHYSELPAKPFVRGFVNSYCRFIGLDSKELLARFDDYINSKASERPNREAGHSGYAFEKRDGEQQSRTLLLVAMFGFVVVGGVAIVFLKPSFHHQRASHVEKLRAAHGVAGIESSISNGKSGGGTSISSLGLPSSSSQSLLLELGSKEVPKIADFKMTEKESTPKEVAQVSKEASVSQVAPTKADDSKEIAKTDDQSESPKINDNHEISKAEVKDEPPKTSASKETVKSEAKEKEEPSQASNTKEVAKATVVSETPESDETDPLDSGLPLKSSEIHHKVIFKILADIWVRYKVDERPIRKFIIRKGNSLVLRGRDAVSVQVSNPKAVMFNYNSQGSKLMSSEKNHTVQHGNALFFFPSKHSNKSEPPFDGNEPLPRTSDPASDNAEGLAIGAKEPLSN
ncbi:MAG: helix-turn-helix domain-containing protein [Bdellovibrionia bacterium]